jgi:hypothetical protein
MLEVGMTIRVVMVATDEAGRAAGDFIMDFTPDENGPCNCQQFVAQMVKDGGLFLNSRKSDWLPMSRILRVYEK